MEDALKDSIAYSNYLKNISLNKLNSIMSKKTWSESGIEGLSDNDIRSAVKINGHAYQFVIKDFTTDLDKKVNAIKEQLKDLQKKPQE